MLVAGPAVARPAGDAQRATGADPPPGVSPSAPPPASGAAASGGALGLSGTVFQTLLRNPLASPDVIGVTLGSSAAAVLAMAVLDAQGMALFWWTLLGGLGTALMTWALDWGREHGASLAQLTTDRSHPDAHRFYDRLGFIPSHVGFKRPL